MSVIGPVVASLAQYGCKDYFIQCSFVNFEAQNIQLLYGNLITPSATYTLGSDGGFNQWVYLLIPTEFKGATNNMYRTFVNSITVQSTSDTIDLCLNVKRVVAASTAGGLRVEGNTSFTLIFEKV
jgi:hypothetical protein